MRRSLALTVAAILTLLAGGVASTRAAATASDDQAAADAAITAFNERMTEAGGVSDGAPDMEPAEPDDDDDAEEPPASDCLNGLDEALEPSGRFEGETARAFSDNFTFASADAPLSTDPMEFEFGENDNVAAGVITVDAAHRSVLDELIATLGSDDVADCLQDELLAADAAAQSGATANSAPPSDVPTADVNVTAEPDLGLGDASTRLDIEIASMLGDDTFGFSTSIFVARSDRTLVFFVLGVANEQVSDLEGREELGALLESLSRRVRQ